MIPAERKEGEDFAVVIKSVIWIKGPLSYTAFPILSEVPIQSDPLSFCDTTPCPLDFIVAFLNET